MPTQKLHCELFVLFCPPLLQNRHPISLSPHTHSTHTVNMEEPKNTVYREEEKNPIVIFFTNLLATIKLPFLQGKNGAPSEPAVALKQYQEPEKLIPSVDKERDIQPSVVAFPRQSFAPVKLEAEAEEGQRSTNPMLLWQVYALGGFLVLRWGWTRWNERKGKKKSDDEPPPTDD